MRLRNNAAEAVRAQRPAEGRGAFAELTLLRQKKIEPGVNSTVSLHALEGRFALRPRRTGPRKAKSRDGQS